MLGVDQCLSDIEVNTWCKQSIPTLVLEDLLVGTKIVIRVKYSYLVCMLS
jgi:hypothetical protein